MLRFIQVRPMNPFAITPQPPVIAFVSESSVTVTFCALATWISTSKVLIPTSQ